MQYYYCTVLYLYCRLYYSIQYVHPTLYSYRYFLEDCIQITKFWPTELRERKNNKRKPPLPRNRAFVGERTRYAQEGADSDSDEEAGADDPDDEVSYRI